jgi:hypothetical protein
LGQAGLVEVDASVTAGDVEGWIAEARAFAAEWAELPAVAQHKLTGKCVRCPLQARSLHSQTLLLAAVWHPLCRLIAPSQGTFSEGGQQLQRKDTPTWIMQNPRP